MTEREQFEEWISAPPHEASISRWYNDRAAWPDQYCDIRVQTAWEAWHAASAFGAHSIGSAEDIASFEAHRADKLAARVAELERDYAIAANFIGGHCTALFDLRAKLKAVEAERDELRAALNLEISGRE